jgi:hypothetical protein
VIIIRTGKRVGDRPKRWDLKLVKSLTIYAKGEDFCPLLLSVLNSEPDRLLDRESDGVR